MVLFCVLTVQCQIHSQFTHVHHSVQKACFVLLKAAVAVLNVLCILSLEILNVQVFFERLA